MTERNTDERARDDEHASPPGGGAGMLSRNAERTETLAVELEPWRWSLLREVLYRTGVEADAREDVPESVATDLFATHALLSKQLEAARRERRTDE